MRVLITGIVRRSKCDEPSGYVYEVDLDAAEQVAMAPTPESEHLKQNRNPRGGLRGGRGMAIWRDCLCISNTDAIWVYDTEWRVQRIIHHSGCARVHDIAVYEDKLYVTSSANDQVFVFTFDGEVDSILTPRDNADLLKELEVKISRKHALSREDLRAGRIDFSDPTAFRLDDYDRMHLNSVCVSGTGVVTVSLGRMLPLHMNLLLDVKDFLNRVGLYEHLITASKTLRRVLGVKAKQNSDIGIVLQNAASALARRDAEGQWSLFNRFDKTAVPNHSLKCWNDATLLYCDTNHGDLLFIDTETGAICERMFVASEFLRGLCVIDRSTALVGSQNCLYQVDLTERRILRKIEVSTDKRLSIYDVIVIPDAFAPLPSHLPV